MRGVVEAASTTFPTKLSMANTLRHASDPPLGHHQGISAGPGSPLDGLSHKTVIVSGKQTSTEVIFSISLERQRPIRAFEHPSWLANTA